MIHCRTLGPLRISVGEAPAPPELLWRKNAALLVYLARSPERRRTREHLCGLLWGDKPESAARHSLNEALRVLRRAGGDQLVRSEGQSVLLSRDGLEIDVDLLEEEVEAEDWGRAAERVEGEFLDGFGVPDSSGFEDWMAIERRNWRRQSVHVLNASAEVAMQRGDVVTAMRAAGRALSLDPESDAAVRAAMRAAALTGERAAALDLYRDFAERLERELAVEPQPETTRLADRIRLERTWRLPEVLSEAERDARRPDLAGRESELKALLEAFDGAREGRSALLAVEGDPGSGKTRLAEEVAARARLDGATVVAIRSVPVDLETAGSGLIGLCRGGLLEAPGLFAAPPGALAGIAAEVGSWSERFSAEIADAEPMSLARAFAEILDPITEEGPLLMVVDDAEWLDETSVLALQGALRDQSRRPFALLLSADRLSSNPQLDPLLSHIGREELGAVVSLGPLDAEAVRALSARTFPDYELAEIDRLSRRVLADSAGLPLLIVELLNAVRLGLELTDREGAWPDPSKTLDQTLPSEVPGAVVSAIRIGFRRLTKEAQTVLSTASVLDERFESALLASVTNLGLDGVMAALDELEWQRWLSSDPRGYSFVARVVKGVIAQDMLTPGQRRRVLDAAGEAG